MLFLLYPDKRFYFAFILLVGIPVNVVALENYELDDAVTGSHLQKVTFNLAAGDACAVFADAADDSHLLARALATLVRPISGSYRFLDTVLDFSDHEQLLAAKRRVKVLDALVGDLERQLTEARAEERVEISEFQVYGIQRHHFVNKLEGLGI